MRKRSKTILVSLFIMVVASTVTGVDALSWDDTVKTGNWVVYETRLSIKTLYGIVHLSYPARTTMEITSIGTNGTNFTVTGVQGQLASFLTMNFGVVEGGSNFIIPSEITVLPQEFLANDSIDIGNTTIPFTRFVDDDYADFWRGIGVIRVDLSGVGLAIPSGTMGDRLLSVTISSSSSSFAKWDATTGFLYEFSISMTGKVNILGVEIDASFSFDTSMVDACTEIMNDIVSRRDHSLDMMFAIKQMFSMQWLPLILLGIGVALFIMLLPSMRKRNSGNVEISTRSDGRRPPKGRKGMTPQRSGGRKNGKHLASERAEKYRKPIQKNTKK